MQCFLIRVHGLPNWLFELLLPINPAKTNSMLTASKNNRPVSTASSLLGCLLVALGNAACQRHHIVIVKPAEVRTKREIQEVMRGQLTETLTDPDYTLVPDMALLSAYIYVGKLPPHQRPNYQSADTINYLEEGRLLAAHGWQPFPFHYRLTPPAQQRMDSGLVYDAWIRTDGKTPPIAVLTFRGTDDKADWAANARPAMSKRDRWDQYEQVRALTPALVMKLDSVYGPGIRIFATGHSLGGGLAQHACYSSQRVEKVFAFNSSPLTGYYDFAPDERPEVTNGRRIYRIYESNEILAIPRFFTGYYRNFPKTSDIVLVRYNFSAPLSGSRGIFQHSMQRLATHLREGK